jgi:hypothetical protein
VPGYSISGFQPAIRPYRAGSGTRSSTPVEVVPGDLNTSGQLDSRDAQKGSRVTPLGLSADSYGPAVLRNDTATKWRLLF